MCDCAVWKGLKCCDFVFVCRVVCVPRGVVLCEKRFSCPKQLKAQMKNLFEPWHAVSSLLHVTVVMVRWRDTLGGI